MNVCLVGGSRSFQPDGQKDIMKITVTFQNFVNAPKNHQHYWNETISWWIEKKKGWQHKYEKCEVCEFAEMFYIHTENETC